MHSCLLHILICLVLAILAKTAAASPGDASPIITGDPGDEEYRLCVESIAACTGGCYNKAGTVTVNGTRVCVPVQPGYYSSFQDDNMFLCDKGTYSDYEQAYYCIKCKLGHFAPSVGSMKCDACPPGSYNPNLASDQCYPCSSSLYSGSGSDSVLQMNGTTYCLAPTSYVRQSDYPSSVPTTFGPSSVPKTFGPVVVAFDGYVRSTFCRPPH
jgi:hypothetical protein